MAKVIELKQAKAADYFTIEEAAGKLNIKPTVVRNYLYEEKLITYKFKTLTLISAKEVEKRMERQKSR